LPTAPASWRLAGTVLDDERGQPLPDVSLCASRTLDGVELGRTTTDGQGRFTLGPFGGEAQLRLDVSTPLAEAFSETFSLPHTGALEHLEVRLVTYRTLSLSRWRVVIDRLRPPRGAPLLSETPRESLAAVRSRRLITRELEHATTLIEEATFAPTAPTHADYVALTEQLTRAEQEAGDAPVRPTGTSEAQAPRPPRRP
jgi:hypothetical protein